MPQREMRWGMFCVWERGPQAEVLRLILRRGNRVAGKRAY